MPENATLAEIRVNVAVLLMLRYGEEALDADRHFTLDERKQLSTRWIEES